MNSNRLDVFAAALQCTVWWSVSAGDKYGERGGRFPTLRHEHLLGLIGRSHSSAQDQVEEREERRRLDGEHGSTIFMLSAKRKAGSPRAAGRLFIYNNDRTLGDAIMTRTLLRRNALDLDMISSIG